MKYSSLEQRMAQNYLDMLPPFIPAENAPVSIREQERFYNLMNNLYRLAFDEPLLFAAALHEDDAYPNRFNKSSYGKPDLLTDMRKFTKTIDVLLQNMFLAGRSGEVKMNKRQQEILSRLGIDSAADFPPAWAWMSNRDEANLQAFAYCLFQKDYPYISDIYARLFGEAAFKKLVNRMLARGYKRFDISDVTGSDCKLSLTIANPKWSDETPSRPRR